MAFTFSFNAQKTLEDRQSIQPINPTVVSPVQHTSAGAKGVKGDGPGKTRREPIIHSPSYGDALPSAFVDRVRRRCNDERQTNCASRECYV